MWSSSYPNLCSPFLFMWRLKSMLPWTPNVRRHGGSAFNVDLLRSSLAGIQQTYGESSKPKSKPAARQSWLTTTFELASRNKVQICSWMLPGEALIVDGLMIRGYSWWTCLMECVHSNSLQRKKERTHLSNSTDQDLFLQCVLMVVHLHQRVKPEHTVSECFLK